MPLEKVGGTNYYKEGQMGNRIKQTGWIGRIFRLVVGFFLVVVAIPIIMQVSSGFLLRVFWVFLGLTLLYLLIHFLVRRFSRKINRWVGALLANVPVLFVFLLGVTDIPVLGEGAGQLAAIVYVGIALLVAGIRADPGCEVMTLPNLFFRSQTHLACLVFSPIDWLEGKIF